MDDLFISYSRRNGEFVRQLYDELVERDLNVWVDWQDIPPTRDWWNEIKEGIEGANAFVFVISPDSLASPICHLEVAHAKLHNKRLIPILYVSADEKQAISDLITRQLDDNTQETLGDRDIIGLVRDNWQEISRHNWLLFEAQEQFETSFETLLTTLFTDYEYVKQHTQWAMRAAHWDHNGRKAGFLLRGEELESARRWLAEATQAEKEPRPNALQANYIAASRKQARRRRLNWGMVGGIVVLALAASLGLALRGPPVRTTFKGQFNILLTTIGEVGSDGLRRSPDGMDLTDMIRTEIENSKETMDELDIDVLWIDDLVPDSQAAEELAYEYHADIVIYGYIRAGEFVPRFTFNPLLTGADEIIGDGAFGSPIPLLLDENVSLADNPLAQPVLDQEFTPRVRALASFLYGLAAFKVDLYQVANTHFTDAYRIPEWADEEGKEILHLWIGTLYEKNYATRQLADITCPIELTASQGEPSLDCALIAYEWAINLNPQFARGYLGLGNTYLSLGTVYAESGFVICSYLTDNAVDYYVQARTRVDHAVPLIVMKSYASSGTAYLRAYEFGLKYAAQDCLDDDELVNARDNMQAALTAYQDIADVPEAQQNAARIYYQLGLVYAYQEDTAHAITTYGDLLELVGPPHEDPAREAAWRSVRWEAYARRAAQIRLRAEETDDREDWDLILSDAQAVIDARKRVDSARWISAAYFYAGLAHEAFGDLDAARQAYAEALARGTPEMPHYEELQTRIEALENSQGA